MQPDFWNNPMVVSAMRLRYRRGSPGLTSSLYLMALVGLGGVLWYYAHRFPMPVGRVFLIAILGIQFALSGLIAMSCVAGSIIGEVTNRTLDFQRIVSLSPREILMGKLIGEPAISYFLAISTVPLAIFCWLWGAAPLWDVAWFYLNLATFTLLCASLGLINTYVANPQAAGKKSSGAGMTIIIFVVTIQFISLRSGGVLDSAWFDTIIGLLTPIDSLRELARGDAWQAEIELWGVGVPSLLAAPLAQMALAGWFVATMSRRLKNPLDPPVSKRGFYGALLVFDLLSAGICYSQGLLGVGLEQIASQFALAHLIATLLLLLGTVPNQAALKSWVWRFRGQQSWIRDSCLAGRAEVTMLLPVACLLGGLVLVVGLVAPTVAGNLPNGLGGLARPMGEIWLVTSLLLLALGMTHQMFVALMEKGGVLFYLLLVAAANALPPLTASLVENVRPQGALLGLDGLALSLSPIVFFVTRAAPSSRGATDPSLLSVAAVGLLMFSFFAFRRWLRRETVGVSDKLRQMGV